MMIWLNFSELLMSELNNPNKTKENVTWEMRDHFLSRQEEQTAMDHKRDMGKIRKSLLPAIKQLYL